MHVWLAHPKQKPRSNLWQRRWLASAEDGQFLIRERTRAKGHGMHAEQPRELLGTVDWILPGVSKLGYSYGAQMHRLNEVKEHWIYDEVWVLPSLQKN